MNYFKFCLAIVAATLFQFILEGLWFTTLFKGLTASELGPVMRIDPNLALNFVSELGLSILIASILTLYPQPGRLSRGLQIGLLVGVLTGINQYVDWYANFNISFGVFINEFTKTVLLGLGSGVIIATIYPTSKGTNR